jgi:hypothetical protein
MSNLAVFPKRDFIPVPALSFGGDFLFKILIINYLMGWSIFWRAR